MPAVIPVSAMPAVPVSCPVLATVVLFASGTQRCSLRRTQHQSPTATLRSAPPSGRPRPPAPSNPQAIPHRIAGSAASLQDVLIAVSEDTYGGGLFRIADATGTPTIGEVARFVGTGSGNGLPALRVDCASGTSWTASGDPGDGLLLSTDGGQSFTHLPVSNPGGGVETIRALGMTPGNPSQIIVGDTDRYLQSSDDAGRTWTLVNDPLTDLDLCRTPARILGRHLGHRRPARRQRGAVDQSHPHSGCRIDRRSDRRAR